VETSPIPEPVMDVDAHDGEGLKIYEIDPELERRLEEEQEAKEQRMDAFLNDPEHSMKIFFSSFYKDKGLCWCEHCTTRVTITVLKHKLRNRSVSKLRDGPILLAFFFGFFIRNNIMPDYEKAFRKAYKITEQARLELPQTTIISMAIPDVFGSACAGLWGSKQPQAWAGNVEDVKEERSAPMQEWEEQLKAHGVEQIDIATTAPVQTEDVWGAQTVPTGTSDGAWADDGPNPWVPTSGAEDWGSSTEAVPTLISFLGPTTIPLTHAPQIVEKSTRYIVSFTPPNPDGNGLDRVLGSVVLAPWKNHQEGSTIAPPELLAGLPVSSTFDSHKDVISAFVDAKTVGVLREGMGLHGVYVQVVESDDTKQELKEKKKSKSRNKGRAKTKGFDGREWWYIDFVYEVVPSFWTDAA